MVEPATEATRGPRWGRLIAMAIAAVVLIAAWLVLKEYTWTISRSTRRSMVERFLQALLLAHGFLLAVAPIGTVVLAWLLLRARRRRERRPLLARGLLLAVSCLFGLVLIESSAAAWHAWTRRIPALPEAPPRATKTERAALPDLPVGAQIPAPGEKSDVEIVVIGESSARGEPYGDPEPPHAPWLSIGQIVGWQLEQIIPARRFHVTVVAVGGDTLEMQHKRLANIERKPDVLIIYCGHNEFHSRFNWERIVPFEDHTSDASAQSSAHRTRDWSTPLARMIREAIARNGVEVAPPPKVTRQLVDWPVCTHDERAEVLADFERRLEAIVTYCERINALPIFVIPPGNDAGYEPNRSIALGPFTKPATEEITRDFKAAKNAEAAEPARAIALYRAFLERQPKFAEAHYRLARLIERSGDFEAANREYVLARDLDGFPQRCPTDLQDVYRIVAERHPRSILIDGQTVLRALSTHGILDDNLFHDAQHPVLIGHIALARAVLDGLRQRAALGWPAERPTPTIDAGECALHFGMTPNRWAIVCGRVVFFYKRTAYLRHDPKHRLAVMNRYEKAAQEIRAGSTPEETGIPGLGTRPRPGLTMEPAGIR